MMNIFICTNSLQINITKLTVGEPDASYNLKSHTLCVCHFIPLVICNAGRRPAYKYLSVLVLGNGNAVNGVLNYQGSKSSLV